MRFPCTVREGVGGYQNGLNWVMARCQGIEREICLHKNRPMGAFPSPVFAPIIMKESCESTPNVMQESVISRRKPRGYFRPYAPVFQCMGMLQHLFINYSIGDDSGDEVLARSGRCSAI
jgi:hypothetical protein